MEVINDQRSEEVYHRCIWSKATAIADSIGIQLQKPRTAGQMRHRANATLTGTAEEYYRINTYLPFVDHCLSELNNRFSDETRPSFLAFKLLPGRINTLTRHEFEDIGESSKLIYRTKMESVKNLNAGKRSVETCRMMVLKGAL